MAQQITTAAIKEHLEATLRSFTRDTSSAISVLQQVQDKFGYLPEEAVKAVADHLARSVSEVFGVITFYHDFRLTPSGEKIIRVCRGTCCHVKGGVRILEEFEKRLRIKKGDTTPDLKYTLETVACIGACALAPTMVINRDVYGKMATKRVAEILSGKEQARPC